VGGRSGLGSGRLTTGTGAVYFGRSGLGWGTSVSLMAYPPGGPASTIVSLPQGQDFGDSYAVTDGNGSTTVFYDVSPCRSGKQDIDEITVP
jgi:hypothetical protein